MEVFNRDIIEDPNFKDYIIREGNDGAHASNCLAAARLWDKDYGGPSRTEEEEHLYEKMFGFAIDTARKVAHHNREGERIINIRGNIAQDKHIPQREKHDLFKLIHETIWNFREHETDRRTSREKIFRTGDLRREYLTILKESDRLKRMSNRKR